MITPTNGRIVWYTPSDDDYAVMRVIDFKPLAAIVVHVWNDHLVNLTVFDSTGVPHKRLDVVLAQDEERLPPKPYCAWMPYQKGQAAKTEAIEAAAKNG